MLRKKQSHEMIVQTSPSELGNSIFIEIFLIIWIFIIYVIFIFYYVTLTNSNTLDRMEYITAKLCEKI